MKNNRSAFNAEDYDTKIKQTLPYYEEFYNQVTDIVALLGRQYLIWLDVGCGTGKMYETANKKVSIKRFVFCDSSIDMLHIAESHFTNADNEFLLTSVQKLNVQNEYDIVTAIQVNHYFKEEDRRLALRNCFCALKEGGIFFSFVNYAPFTQTGKDIVQKRWKKYQIDRGRSLKEVEAHLKRYGKEYYPITLTQSIELLKEIGFSSVEVIWLSYMQAGLMGIK